MPSPRVRRLFAAARQLEPHLEQLTSDELLPLLAKWAHIAFTKLEEQKKRNLEKAANQMISNIKPKN